MCRDVCAFLILLGVVSIVVLSKCKSENLKSGISKDEINSPLDVLISFSWLDRDPD